MNKGRAKNKKTDWPQMLVSESSEIILCIFLDEKIHLPFHVESTPSETYSITVRRINGSSVDEHPADLYYLYHLDELLESEGVVIENGKWTVVDCEKKSAICPKKNRKGLFSRIIHFIWRVRKKYHYAICRFIDRKTVFLFQMIAF